MNRRHLFALLGGAAVAPLLPAAEPLRYGFTTMGKARIVFDDSLIEPLRYDAAGLARLQASLQAALDGQALDLLALDPRDLEDSVVLDFPAWS